MRVAEIKAVLRPELGADEWHAKGFASRPHPQSLLPPDLGGNKAADAAIKPLTDILPVPVFQ